MQPIIKQTPEYSKYAAQLASTWTPSITRHTGLALLLLFVVLTQAACGGGQSSEEYITRAERHLDGKNYKAASIELKNALQQDSKSAHARWLLGKMLLDTGDIAGAEKEFLLALKLGWNPNDVRPALARTQLAQGKYVPVRELDYKDLDPLPASDLLTRKASAELAQGETEEAARLVALALDKDPESLEAKIVNARVAATLGDTASAMAGLEEVLSQAPDQAVAWRLKGDILLQQQDPKGALTAFNKAIALSGSAFQDRFKRALIQLQLQDFEAAQADTDWLLQAAPQHPASNYLQGVLHFREQRYAEAITSLSVAEPAAEQFPLVLFYLGSAHLIEGNQDRAAGFASQFHDLAPDNINGRKLLATIRLQQGKFDDTQELIQPVLNGHPDDSGALNLMANALLGAGKTSQGIDLLARVAELNPDSPAAQVRLGAGLLLNDQGDEATRHLETALELSPEFQQADILLVMNLLRDEQFDEAVAAAEAYRRRNPTSTAPYNLLGRVYLASGKQAEAKATFEKALRLNAGDAGANHNLAALALADNDLGAARGYYQAVLASDPDSLATLLQLARLDAREQNEEALVANLEQAINAHPTALEPRLMLARYYLSSGKADQVAPLFTTLEDSQRKSPQVLQLLALAQLSGQQNTEAKYTLEQLIEASPDTASSHHLLAVAAARGGDAEQAKQELGKALAIDANYLPALLASARLALAEENTSAFDDYIGRLDKLAPEAPDVLRLKAAAAYRANDSDSAAKLASTAFEAAPNTQTVLELYNYQRAAGEPIEAEQLLAKWLADHPQDTSARIAYASAMQTEQDIQKANEQYQAIIASDPENAISLNNLAWNLRLEQPQQALEYARRAAELAPERPEILDTLAVIEHLNGEHLRAQRNLDRALEKAPGNPSMLYHRAMIEAALDQPDNAIATLKALLAPESPDFPERTEAQELLNSLQG